MSNLPNKLKPFQAKRNTVEVFKTNIPNTKIAKKIVDYMRQEYPDYKINFDLEDCDRIMRVEGTTLIDTQTITMIVAEFGVFIEVLSD